ncbi:MAG: hypothetical protein ACK4F9_00085 [Brevinematia bacterium]
MSKFPNHETFKEHKTFPQKFVEKFIYFDDYTFLSRNIFPKKMKKCYVYDIKDQKIADFFLDYGRLYLGFSDKFITKMVKNYLKSTIFSYSTGIFTYRFLKLINDLTCKEFRNIFFARSLSSLGDILSMLLGKNFSVNSYYTSIVFGKKLDTNNPDVFEPFNEFFLLEDFPTSIRYLFLGRGIRYYEVLERLSCIDIGGIVMSFGRFFVVLSNERILNKSKDFSFVSEFESMIGYYYLLREKFLISRKIYRLKNYTERWLKKFVDIGVADGLSPYAIYFSKKPEYFHDYLIREGIFSYGNTLFFSFQHDENDFKRLRRKLNQVFGISS